jgi:hypothetical protein
MYGRSFRRKKKRSRTKRRALVLLAAVVLTCGMYFKMPLVSLAPVETPAADSFSSALSPAAPNPDLSARDPFAVPRDFLPKPKNEPAAAVRTEAAFSPNNSRRDIIPQLTGVVMAANGGSAIIQYGATSLSYQQGDLVGSYRVVAIGSDSVILRGPSGPLTLGMGK